MEKFDTQVQYIKYKVLSLVAKKAFEGELLESIPDMPKEIIPGKEASMRCCVYKERAIINERVRLAIGGSKNDDCIVEVIDIACDECPVGGYEITNACRGCIAHRCAEICPRGAITFDIDQKAHINKSLCVECGKCAEVCPYSAIL
ncbi:4Fe-4S binding protein, partial [Tyzzerella sp. OttesenSCG-928-J15]|nr:4Fe-4S binding protein [Tyzzerella sp. OttesenSCG-928-J15]